ncbi:hypothetical protein [Methylovulum psychrotolerans]|jgi:hypothetical protein|uniref:Sodium:solute symporter n=1 Tax=Methylovulum psychrotolerans TaxID=1704499 RepID=A0A1Z4BW38_9GAMM|nr:hypothetical protein [Methylovulum psychrotolerans]ASF45463.1 hypothetical protein CEK71_04940 [Methylovulum psychrotolerans]POZ49934.1 hypothetical protein AADEFJLK_04294 [Methylovulum psychrotolerans]
MLILAKAAGIAILVWFYLTAKEKGQPAFQWAIIGVIGYWVAWWAFKLTALAPLAALFTKSPTMIFLVTQIPALCGMAAAYFIRKKLLADVAAKSE